MRPAKKIIIFSIIMILGLILSDKGFSQLNGSSRSDDSEGRLIYEQTTSYEDALLMKKKVEQIEREEQSDTMSSTQGHPLLEAIDQNVQSEEKSEVIAVLSQLLKTLGVYQEVSVPVDEEQQQSQPQQSGEWGQFKRWEDRHEWQGIRTETK